MIGVKICYNKAGKRLQMETRTCYYNSYEYPGKAPVMLEQKGTTVHHKFIIFVNHLQTTVWKYASVHFKIYLDNQISNSILQPEWEATRLNIMINASLQLFHITIIKRTQIIKIFEVTESLQLPDNYHQLTDTMSAIQDSSLTFIYS